MSNLFGVLAGIEDMASNERADLLRQVAILAESFARDIELAE